MTAYSTTLTTLTELVHAEWINPFILSYAANYKNPSQFLLKMDPTNGSSTVSAPRWVSDEGDVADEGAAVDTEYDASEDTDLEAVALETLDETFSISEYGLMRTVTDHVIESAQSAASVLASLVPNATSTLMAASNQTACALFASFTNQSGDTSADPLTIAFVDDAIYDLAERGVTGELVGILHHDQVRHFSDAMQAISSSAAHYSDAADRQMAHSASSDQGRNAEGLAFRYKGVSFYRNGLCATANTGANVVGSIFCRGDIPMQADMAAIGQGSLREFRVETERNASLRATEFVFTMRWGCGIINNAHGQEVISDKI
jgi:hypothetical protein